MKTSRTHSPRCRTNKQIKHESLLASRSSRGLGSGEASSAVDDADVELVSALDDLLAGGSRDAVVDHSGVLAVVEEEHVEVL